jgi:predicted nucleic acid-binding Zn ribbon protein
MKETFTCEDEIHEKLSDKRRNCQRFMALQAVFLVLIAYAEIIMKYFHLH